MMKSLNASATDVLVRFIDRLGKEPEIYLPSARGFPIHITRGRAVTSPKAEGYILGIGQVYNDSPPQYQPLWKLIVVDHRPVKGNLGRVLAYPHSFSDDLNGIYEEACAIRDGTITCYRPMAQKAHARFLYRWLLPMAASDYLP